MLDDKEESRIKEDAIKEKVEKFDKMTQRIQELEQQVHSNAAAATILGEMIQKGEAIQDQEGRVSVVKESSAF